MASTYGYITVANLEAYTGINYETTDAAYTDAYVEAQITLAERIVNSMSISAPTATADGTIVATLILSERLMRNVMIMDNHAEETPQEIARFFDHVVGVVLEPGKYSPVDSIPMNAIDPRR